VGRQTQVGGGLAHDLEAEAKAHEGTGLSAGAYGLLQVLRSFDAGDGAAEVATRTEHLYRSDATAPPRWQEKEGLRKSLRQQVRRIIHDFGLKNLKDIPEQIEEFALKHFAKV